MFLHDAQSEIMEISSKSPTTKIALYLCLYESHLRGKFHDDDNSYKHIQCEATWKLDHGESVHLTVASPRRVIYGPVMCFSMGKVA